MAFFELWKELDKRAKRFPRLYDADLSKVFVQVLANLDGRFRTTRPASHLTRLVCLQYFLRKELLRKMQVSSRRCFAVKAFKSAIGEKKVLTIAFGVNALHSHELLEEKHIFKAISRFLPGIKIVPESFYSCKEKDLSFLFCYFEIEKLRGTNITSAEVNLLKKMLPIELKQSIQFLTPSLLMPYNEEEIYKSLKQLAGELKTVTDLPQVMISFQAQVQEFLRFNVVAARICKKNAIPFTELSKLLPSTLRLAGQRMVQLGVLGKYQKEGLIFSFEIDYDFFLKKNWSIDLRQARNYIVKVLEQLIGIFRDYNGGLLSQQDKQFEQILLNLRGKHENLYPFIEEVFYSFTPPLFQTLLSSRTCIELFALFIRLLKKDLPEEGFLMESRAGPKSSILVVKALSSKLQEQFLKEIQSLDSLTGSCCGCSSVEFEGLYYLFLVDLDPDSQFLENCRERIKGEREPQKSENCQKSLRINFQEGDPPSLNPQIGIDQRCRTLGRALFEGLTRLNAKGVPEPAAAKEIQISDCQTIYTFTLREHYWSNGELVTAYDFEHTWKKALSSFSNCLRSDLFFPIKNARSSRKGLVPLEEVKIKAVNAKKLIVELEHPVAHFLHLLAHPIFSPLYKGEEEPAHFNGPFMVREWQKEQILHLTSNPYYWDKKKVLLQDIYISMIKDFKTVDEKFWNEKLDWIGDPYSVIPKGYHSDKWDEKGWKEKEVDQVWWIYLNTLSFPLNSASIRKALACAIDRTQIASAIGQVPILSPIPETQLKEYARWDANHRLAQEFFAKGLKELDLSLETFPQLTFHYSDIPGQEYLAKIIQSQLEAVLNIQVKLIRIEWNNLSRLLDKREYQLAGCLRSAPYFYPRSHLEFFRDRTNLYNSSQWEDPQYEELLKKAQSSTDPEARDALLKQAEQILIEEMPVIAIFRHIFKYRFNPKIKGISIAQNGDVDLKLITI